MSFLLIDCQFQVDFPAVDDCLEQLKVSNDGVFLSEENDVVDPNWVIVLYEFFIEVVFRFFCVNWLYLFRLE